jgi:hypothetical protein
MVNSLIISSTTHGREGIIGAKPRNKKSKIKMVIKYPTIKAGAP